MIFILNMYLDSYFEVIIIVQNLKFNKILYLYLKNKMIFSEVKYAKKSWQLWYAIKKKFSKLKALDKNIKNKSLPDICYNLITYASKRNWEGRNYLLSW
jgi:hypothetical protein